ncbi:hypothetical protein PVIIG_06192 [Plasmodium vivax India VII]|uniref:Uncharacterized protein n=1 Tax=Plasmodium vivax India VII TaxID=1077284 RepID=A0A0J9V8T1_PLAVI|nr:hypothetical protein PVIIG_06192 [Plasmodium vivax India VII]
MKQKNERSSYVSFKRVLAKGEMQREFKYTNVRENLSHNRFGKDIKSKLEFTSTYGDKKRVGLNKLDVYKKGYKDRYNKKTGLGKLDCYFEKKYLIKLII